MTDIKERVRRCFAEHPEDNILNLEEEFGIEIPDGVELKTQKQAVKYITKRLKL